MIIFDGAFLKNIKANTIKIIAFAMILGIVALLPGCAWFDSKVNELRGDLKGVSYTAEFFDNNGDKFLTTSGSNINMEGNKVAETGFDSEGYVITNYSLSSVITITIDGKQMVSCGDTIIFTESGLSKDVDFTLTDIESKTDGGLDEYTFVAKVVNNYKNYFGKPMVVVIQSQLGVPICAYSGNEVFWEVCDDLPKTTKLMIDGKAVYIHRANFQIIDKDLIK